MPLPAVSFDESTWYFHHDKALVTRVTEILKPIKMFKRSFLSREHLRAKRAGDINQQLLDALIRAGTSVAQDTQVVEHIGTNYAGSPVPGRFDTIQEFPAMGDDNSRATLGAAYAIIYVRVGTMAPAQVPQERLSWVTASILGIVYAYLTDPQNQEMIQQSFNVPRRGLMGNACPKKEDNECGHRLCQGTNEVCEYTFLKGCACSDTCPNEEDSIRWFICDEEECGGADEFGECKGATGGPNIGANKGCFCAHIDDNEPLSRDTSHYRDLQKFLNANFGKPDSGKPEGDAVKRKQCYKEDQERIKDHQNWKFVRQTVLDEAIKNQCDRFKQTGEPGDKEIQDFGKKDDWDYAKLKIYEPEPGMVTREMCNSKFLEISVGCDSSPEQENNPNQFNWKWGGEIELENGIKFSIEPVWSRVWTDSSQLSWWNFLTGWSDPDGNHHCYSLKKFSDNGNKGNNGAELDDKAKMTLQQCIHQALYMESSDNDISCGGLLNFGFHRKDYDSGKDCSTNTWKCVSYFVEQGESGRGEHKPDFADCWMDLMFA